MELELERSRRTAMPRTERLQLPPWTGPACWLLGFALPFYLALRGGGYEPVLRDQVGIALWWIVIVGVIVGVLPSARPSRAQLIALSALAAFAAWSGLGALWSQSSEATVVEFSRLSAYTAVLALAILAVRAGVFRHLLAGAAAAIAAVALVALLSRLHPAWFPGANETARLLSGARSRLNYPIDYWNGLAAMIAMGFPLLLHFAGSARRLIFRALSAGALPTMLGALYLTFSRGGWVELAVAMLVLLALSPARLWRVATLVLAAGGGALLIAAIEQRPAIANGMVGTAAANHGGDELIAVAVLVFAGVTLLHAALSLLERHANPPALLSALARPRAWPWAVAAIAAIAAFLIAGGPHLLSHLWHDFRNPVSASPPAHAGAVGHLASLSGEGRYQYWSSSLAAFATNPLGGIGAGTWGLWWAAHGSIYSYVINAHSLYFEVLAVTGLVGLLLLLATFGAGAFGVARRWRSGSPERRARLAAAVAALAAFCTAAIFDWVWQIPALPAVALLVMGGALARPRNRPARAASSAISRRARAGWLALALAGVAVIAVPMASAVSLRESQAQALSGRLPTALQDARAAGKWQPYGSEPHLQQALVLEQERRFAAAAAQARAATEAAPTDWSIWLVLSRIEAERGRARPAVAAFDRAHSLDPHDPYLSNP